MNQDDAQKRRQLVALLAETGRPFPLAAYDLVLETVKLLTRHLTEAGKSGPELHLSGALLANGLRDCLLNRYGCLAKDVLDAWRIHSTADFGTIVYDLIEVRLLQANSHDDISDFDDVYDFDQAFVLPFIPKDKPDGFPVIAPLDSPAP